MLRKSLDSEYEKLCNRFDKLVGDDDKDAEGIRIIKEMLIQIYTDSCKDAAYFSDKTYSNIVPMDVASFRGLFNYLIDLKMIRIFNLFMVQIMKATFQSRGLQKREIA